MSVTIYRSFAACNGYRINVGNTLRFNSKHKAINLRDRHQFHVPWSPSQISHKKNPNSTRVWDLVIPVDRFWNSVMPRCFPRIPADLGAFLEIYEHFINLWNAQNKDVRFAWDSVHLFFEKTQELKNFRVEIEEWLSPLSIALNLTTNLPFLGVLTLQMLKASKCLLSIKN